MKINLLTIGPGEKKSTVLYRKVSLKNLLLGFFIFWLIGIIFSFFLTDKINSFKKSVAKIKGDLKTTDSAFKERDFFLKRLQESDNFLSLLKGGFKKDISWSKKLINLTDLVPEEIWLKEISLRKEEKGAGVQLFLDIQACVGYLKNDEELLGKINNFIETIKKENDFIKDFEEVSLLEINKSKLNQENVMDFRLSLSFSQPQVLIYEL